MKALSYCICALLLLAQGCSMLAPYHQTVTITASDPQAEILVNNQPVGQGTAVVKLPRNQRHVVIAKNQTSVGRYYIGRTVSPAGVLDIIGGVLFLFPFIGVVTPGFYSLDSTRVFVDVGTQASSPADAPVREKCSATGFFVTAEGHLITNYHVVRDAVEITIRTNEGSELSARTIRVDKDNDLALLKTEGDTAFLPLSKHVPGKAHEVCALGFPLTSLQGHELKSTFGRINSLSGLRGDVRYIQVDCPIQPGNSGGPLLDRHGQVVGVVTARLNELATLEYSGSLPQNVNYALKVDFLREFLRGIDLPMQEAALEQDFADVYQNSEAAVAEVTARLR